MLTLAGLLQNLATAADQQLQLRRDDHICYIGNLQPDTPDNSAHSGLLHKRQRFDWGLLRGLWAGHPTNNRTAYKSSTRKRADRIEVQRQNDQTIFLVTSESGIGKATVKLTAGQWPKKSAVRLRYASGRGFGNLEMFQCKTATIGFLASLHNSKGARWYRVKKDGQFETSAEVDGPHVIVRREKDWIEVELPDSLFNSESKSLGLDWIRQVRKRGIDRRDGRGIPLRRVWNRTQDDR